MRITVDDKLGQNRFWSIYPLDDESSIRVNQLIDITVTPHIYQQPRIEISTFWLLNLWHHFWFIQALSLARHQWIRWNRDTGREL